MVRYHIVRIRRAVTNSSSLSYRSIRVTGGARALRLECGRGTSTHRCDNLLRSSPPLCTQYSLAPASNFLYTLQAVQARHVCTSGLGSTLYTMLLYLLKYVSAV